MAQSNDAFLCLFNAVLDSSLTFSFLVTLLRAVLVENIPDDISFLDNATSHLSLTAGLYGLLDNAIRAVEIVSPLWLLNSSDYESSFQPAAKQVKPGHANRDSALLKL